MDNKKKNSCVIKEVIITGIRDTIKDPIADRPFTKEAAAQIEYEKLLNDEMYQFEIELQYGYGILEKLMNDAKRQFGQL